MDKKPKYKVEKDVTIPPQNYKESKYPFDEMEINDYFFVPAGDLGSVKSPLQSLRGAARTYCKRYPDREFTARRIKDGFRVWRVK